MMPRPFVRSRCDRRPWRRAARAEDGQGVSEYVTLVGITAATVIACMALFVTPVARAYIALFRKLVLQFTSVP
jgi:Flp pilus assembly pilin Flp